MANTPETPDEAPVTMEWYDPTRHPNFIIYSSLAERASVSFQHLVSKVVAAGFEESIAELYVDTVPSNRVDRDIITDHLSFLNQWMFN